MHTGAGISTSCGIPDFRGPKGVWTLEKQGIKPKIDIKFENAIPSTTHRALKLLLDKGYIKFIVSQNIDGLHLRSGVARQHLAELHGNMFIEECEKCKKQFIRKNKGPVPTVAKKLTGDLCRSTTRPCRGSLIDTVRKIKKLIHTFTSSDSLNRFWTGKMTYLKKTWIYQLCILH